MVRFLSSSKLALFLIFFLLSSISLASGVDYHLVSAGDFGIYLYFSPLLGNVESALDLILSSNASAINASEEIFSIANMSYGTLLLYGPSNQKALEVASLFLSLSRGLVEVANGSITFQNAFEMGDYSAAQGALFLMEDGREEVGKSLSELSTFTLMADNGSPLGFDLKPLYSRLNRIEGLIKGHESLLSSAKPSNFTVFSSSITPYACDNLTVYGFAPNLTDVNVVVNGKSFPVNVTNSSFRLLYSPKAPGLYSVYATALNGTVEVRSNELLLNVSRCPTRIIAREVLESGASIAGILVDYSGKPLGEKKVELLLNGSIFRTVTSYNGSFFLSLPPVTSEVNATLLFRGDGFYAPSNLTLLIFPESKTLLIKIWLERGSYLPKEPAVIKGSLSSDEPLPVYLYVDGKPNSTLRLSRSFTIKLNLPMGKHRVYLLFKGGSGYLPSTSNVVVVEVMPINYERRILLLVVILVALFLSYRLVSTRSNEEETVEMVRVEEPPREGLEVSPRRAFVLLFSFLRRFYSLSPSTTPRELLMKLKDQPFMSSLKQLVELHESAVYGGKTELLKAVNVVKRVSGLIVSVVVGDEL